MTSIDRLALVMLCLGLCITCNYVEGKELLESGGGSGRPPRPRDDAPGLKHEAMDRPPQPMQGQEPGDDPRDVKPPGSGKGPRLNLPDDSAGFKVFLNSSDSDNFIHVKFGRVQEVERDGTAVKGHIINSLAALPGGLEQGYALAAGTNVTYVQITVPLNQTGPSFKPCAGQANTTYNGSIVISCYITSGSNATFPYGYNNTVTAPAYSMKFNIEAYDWPFCSQNNSLAVDVFMSTRNASAPRTKTDQRVGPEGTRPDVRAKNGTRARLAFAPGKVAAFNFPGYATDGPDGNRTFAIDVRSADDPERTGYTFVFPASNAIYYDPVVAEDTTSTAAEIAALSAVTASPSPSALTRSPSPSPASKKNAAGRSFAAISSGLYLLAAGVCTLFVYA